MVAWEMRNGQVENWRSGWSGRNECRGRKGEWGKGVMSTALEGAERKHMRRGKSSQGWQDGENKEWQTKKEGKRQGDRERWKYTTGILWHFEFQWVIFVRQKLIKFWELVFLVYVYSSAASLKLRSFWIQWRQVIIVTRYFRQTEGQT